MMKRVLYILLGILTAASCYRFDPSEANYTDGPIWPDYMDVTVPVGIAPLNFCYTAADGPVPVTTFSHGDMNISIKGREVVWKDREWKKLLGCERRGHHREKQRTSRSMDHTCV